MARGLKFGFRKQIEGLCVYVAKTKVLISCAVTVFVFAFAKSRFSHNEAHIIIYINRHDRHADKNPYRHDSRADKNPYRHDRRADSQCLHKNLKVLCKTTLFFSIIQLNRYGNHSKKSEKITEY